VLRHLSPEWIAALDEAAQASASLRAAATDLDLTVQQVVTGGDDEVTWYVRLRGGEVAVHPGRADDPDVTFTQDRDTARAIADGELSAQAAFMAGRLRTGGDLTQLLAHREALADLDDVFADVRARTEPVA
jgi:putative sterol carrier protein